jgi:hypothetical protein
MSAIKQALRYLIAVVVSPFVGALFAIPYSIALDIIYGDNVTGGVWALTTPNVLVAIWSGLVTGWFAGWIAGRRGKLIGGVANFAILIFVIAASLAMNRDLIPDHLFATKASMWTWIGLIPAIIGGHFAVKAKDIGAPAFFGLFAQAVSLCSQVCWLIFHLYTVYVAFKMAGLFGAFLSLIFPAVSEIFWFFKLWNISHQFVNLYSARLFLAIAMSGLALGIGIIAAVLQSRRDQRATALAAL